MITCAGICSGNSSMFWLQWVWLDDIEYDFDSKDVSECTLFKTRGRFVDSAGWWENLAGHLW